jgi:multicomponent Na+:H+ antiporter subunit A
VASATGDQFLTSSIAEFGLPLIGTVKLVSSTVFDIGVYVLVLGVVLSVLTHLGAESGIRPRRVAGPRASRRARAR